jgi:DNA-binding NarL/FixJ family response regulator
MRETGVRACGLPPAGGAASRMGTPPSVRQNQGVSRRILIVDDHAGFRATARRMLEAEGFRVVGEAADAEEAIRAIKRLRPDVVLLDVQLPDRDGVEAAGVIDAIAPLPAVVLTSSRPRDDIGPLEADCIQGFLRKDELTAAAIEELVS